MKRSLEILRDTITGDIVAVVAQNNVYGLETVLTCPTVLNREDLWEFLSTTELSIDDLREMVKALYEHVEALEAQYEDPKRRTYK